VKGWIALPLLAASSCDSSSVVCLCPANGCDFSCSGADTAVILVPAGFPPVSSATADNACSATYQSFANRVLVSRSSEGTCDVTVQFTSGDTYAAHLRFSYMHYPCGCYLGAFASSLEPTDA
jgi:hypothetical protein